MHYTGDKGKMQTLDLIESIGDAEAFCRSNAIKYLSRFGKKDGKNRKDILKSAFTIVHYYIISLLMTTTTKLPMKLSDRTINLLKNFATINQSILFKQGNQLRTISVMKNILAEANIDEDFPQDFGVYDLSQFLNSLGLFQEPELNFTGESFVNIKEGKTEIKIFLCRS